MILCIPLMNLKPVFLGVIALWPIIFMEVLTPSPLLWGRNFEQLAGVLLVYGGGSGNFWVNYPLLAWVEIVVCGILFGRILLNEKEKAYRLGSWIGMICLVGFVLLRSMNGFGTIRPLENDTWMGFLSVVKYPPSLVFVLLTMGINPFTLGIFSRLGKNGTSNWNPLVVFG